MMRVRTFTLAAVLVIAAGVTSAQTTRIVQGGVLPPRDNQPTAPTATGTAAIRGRVFASDSGRPLRRARIQVYGPQLGGEGRATSTNAEGRYEIKDLAAGRYTINVTRSGYLRLSYGQRRPFEQGKPFDLVEGQRADNVEFTLPRMSLITGRILDEANEPISGVRVWAMRPVYFEGRRKLVHEGTPATTDDAGQYRLLGLTPGSYFVMADIRETWTVVENGIERVMGYAQTYYPGTPGFTDARRVEVGVGAEANNTDFALMPGRAATVSGTVVDSQGKPLAGRQLALAQEFRGPNQTFATTSTGATIAADGSFRLPNLAPGEYKLSVRASVDVGGTTIAESAATPIVVSGVDIDNIALITSSGYMVSGKVVTDDGAVIPAATLTRTRIMPRALNSDAIAVGPPPIASPDNGRVTGDGSFTLAGVTGPMRLRVNGGDDWALKSILLNSRDVTDEVLQAQAGDTLSNLEIILTSKVSVLSGALTDGKGAPTTDGTVLVFADDSQKWLEDSRYVRAARPDQQGTFQIKGLPPGDYQAVALEYVEDGSWNDPELLESLRPFGQRIRIQGAESQTLALKLTAPR